MDSSSMPRVLITRPAGQHQDFAARCKEIGFDVSLLPCLQIVARPVEQQLLLQKRDAHEAVLFTSANAVRCAHAIAPLPWPATKVHAIGAATAQCLQAHGQSVCLQPQSPFNSEAYLAQLEQQTPASLLIVKGQGGRGIIQPRLLSAGWCVDSVDVYDRVTPALSPQLVNAAFSPVPPDIISVTSNDVLKNLYQSCLDHRSTLINTPLVVNSERCADLARELGFMAEMHVAVPAGDTGQLVCLQRWKALHTHQPG